ncbi:aldo/keto reductase [uncultured Jatrophihabitans sp.]|uniref:aldo/keto reductase n=1 Tax=uncultured Jatrophihabitans sp. TaxID=1610747 RepID=UPI0035CC1C20
MDVTTTTNTSDTAGTFDIAGHTVRRLGFGAMRLTGEGIWGPPADRDECVRVVRRAVELGVELIDTADSYGPYVSEEIIREALHPYPEQVLIATKAGLVRTGPNEWLPVARPEYLRQEVEMSLRRLGLERIELFQLHRIDEKVALEDQIGELVTMRDEGKIGAIGLSEVSVAELEQVRAITDVATVQNRYNLVDRKSEDVLDHCEREGIGFIPWAPVQAGSLARPGGPVDDVASATGASASQVALAWLLARSPVILPIPGTSSVTHLEDNMGAIDVALSAEQVSELTGAGGE